LVNGVLIAESVKEKFLCMSISASIAVLRLTKRLILGAVKMREELLGENTGNILKGEEEKKTTFAVSIF
jgi:hypothetical protein